MNVAYYRALLVNPASFLLEKVEGYKIKRTSKQINHTFFVDDLKLFAESMNIVKLLLDIITTYSRDTGMKFGEDKCAYVLIIRGKRKSGNGPIEINGLKVRKLKDEEEYKYLRQDESVGYSRPLNKERVVKEYKERVRKIWSLALHSNNKVMAHNTLAVPVITPTFGILDWIKQKITSLDIAT